MIREIKTALLGDEQQTDSTWAPERHKDADGQGDDASDVSDASTPSDTSDASNSGDAVDAQSVDRMDPFRPEFDLRTAADGEAMEMDEVFGILGNERRRFALKFLSMEDDTVTMSDLAEQVAAWECGKETTQLSSQERKRVYVSLYQCHLPKMAAASAVSYDKGRGMIEPGEQFEQFGHYLRDDD